MYLTDRHGWGRPHPLHSVYTDRHGGSPPPVTKREFGLTTPVKQITKTNETV